MSEEPPQLTEIYAHLRDMPIRTIPMEGIGLRMLHPETIWDALPEGTRTRIDMTDFQNILETCMFLWVEYQMRGIGAEIGSAARTIRSFPKPLPKGI